jgi:hypothetical protein
VSRRAGRLTDVRCNAGFGSNSRSLRLDGRTGLHGARWGPSGDRTLAHARCLSLTCHTIASSMTGDRILEFIAAAAAVVFLAAMVWSDFSPESVKRWERVRPIQYATALTVLASVIALAIRDT